MFVSFPVFFISNHCFRPPSTKNCLWLGLNDCPRCLHFFKGKSWSLNYHNEIKAAFGVVSPVLTGQQLFGGMMTHQKRANAVLTTVNSCSGVGHLCACPVSCRNSLVQTSIRRRHLGNKAPNGNASGVCQRRSGSVRGGQEALWRARGKVVFRIFIPWIY